MHNSITNDILGAFFVMWLVAWWNDWPPVADQETTTYRMVCHNCKPAEMILYREVFRAEPATHTVTSWSKESGYISIFRDCAIKDRKNWRCDTKSLNSSEPQLADGVFSENSNSHLSEQIAWYHWWWLRFLQATR